MIVAEKHGQLPLLDAFFVQQDEAGKRELVGALGEELLNDRTVVLDLLDLGDRVLHRERPLLDHGGGGGAGVVADRVVVNDGLDNVVVRLGANDRGRFDVLRVDDPAVHEAHCEQIKNRQRACVLERVNRVKLNVDVQADVQQRNEVDDFLDGRLLRLQYTMKCTSHEN